MHARWPTGFAALLLLFAAITYAPAVAAYPDTQDGAIATAATAAVAKGDITPVLRWVNADQEEELRVAFQEAVLVRTKGPEAQALADKYFAQTLVRLHRVGRDEPYTGLKPASAQLPILGIADKAVESGTADELVKAVTVEVAEGIAAHLREVLAARAKADTTVEAGRDFVASYESYLTYVEALFTTADRDAAQDDQEVADTVVLDPTTGARLAAKAAHPAAPAAAKSAKTARHTGGKGGGGKRAGNQPPAKAN